MKYKIGDSVECRWGINKGATGVVTDISVEEAEEVFDEDEQEDDYETYEVLWDSGQFVGRIDMWYEEDDLIPYVNAPHTPEDWS